MKRRWNAKELAALAFALLVTLLIILLNPAADLQKNIGDWGYLGVFLIMLITSATVILPAPGLLAVFAAGGAYNFFLVGIAGGLGSALGELSGYLFGYGSLAFVEAEKYDIYKRTRGWMERNGFLTLFIFSVIPNPLFDVAGIAAGSMKYPWPKFLAACALGKIVKSIIFAYLGYALLP